jgi:hypothetical protein
VNASSRPLRAGFTLAFGVLLILAGLVLALENAGIEVPDSVTRLWPLLLVLLGLARLAQRGFLRVGGHLLIFLGCFLIGLQFRPGATLSLAGPVGLLWLGVIITVRALRPAEPRPRAGDEAPASPEDCD